MPNFKTKFSLLAILAIFLTTFIVSDSNAKTPTSPYTTAHEFVFDAGNQCQDTERTLKAESHTTYSLIHSCNRVFTNFADNLPINAIGIKQPSHLPHAFMRVVNYVRVVAKRKKI